MQSQVLASRTDGWVGRGSLISVKLWEVASGGQSMLQLKLKDAHELIFCTTQFTFCLGQGIVGDSRFAAPIHKGAPMDH